MRILARARILLECGCGGKQRFGHRLRGRVAQQGGAGIAPSRHIPFGLLFTGCKGICERLVGFGGGHYTRWAQSNPPAPRGRRQEANSQGLRVAM